MGYRLGHRNCTLRWSYPLESTFSSPTVADGKVFVAATDGMVYALDASSGVLSWATPIGEFPATPAVCQWVVYVGRRLHAVRLDATTGVLLWFYPTGGHIASSAGRLRLVFVASWDSAVTPDALRAKSDGQPGPSDIIRLLNRIANGVVYSGSRDGSCMRQRQTGVIEGHTRGPHREFLTRCRGGSVYSPRHRHSVLVRSP